MCRDRSSSKTAQSYIVDVEVALLILMFVVELTSSRACSDVILAVLMKTPCTNEGSDVLGVCVSRVGFLHNNWKCSVDFLMHYCHYFSCIYAQ